MSKEKVRVGFFDFAGCEGCQLTVIDTLQLHPELIEILDIVSFREASSAMSDDFDLAFVEGSITRASDEDRLLAIRERAKVVIALGACACTGSVNALRNQASLETIRKQVYGDLAEHYEADHARPISEFIPIEGFIPGCPIDRGEFARAITSLLQGLPPEIPDYPLCVECRLKENACLLERGKPCLGPVVRAGCGALCPSHGVPCEGCRGFIPDANLPYLRKIFSEMMYSQDEIHRFLDIFLSHPLIDMQASPASITEA